MTLGLVGALMRTHVIVIARENFSKFNRAPRALDYVMWQIQLCKVLSAFNAIQIPNSTSWWSLAVITEAFSDYFSLFFLSVVNSSCLSPLLPKSIWEQQKKKEICHKNWLPFSQRAEHMSSSSGRRRKSHQEHNKDCHHKWNVLYVLFEGVTHWKSEQMLFLVVVVAAFASFTTCRQTMSSMFSSCYAEKSHTHNMDSTSLSFYTGKFCDNVKIKIKFQMSFFIFMCVCRLLLNPSQALSCLRSSDET